MNDAIPQPASDHLDPRRYHASRHVTQVSIATNLVLAMAQVLIGLIGHSQALVADGMHTLSDMVTDGMVLFALKQGSKAADKEHPYGHGRIETAVTMLLGGLLIAVATVIAVRAAIQLADARPFLAPSVITLWVAAGTIAAKEGLYHYTIRTANRYESDLLRANAWHHRSDAISSLIVFAGIGGSLLGFLYLDAVAAIIIALLITKIGAQLTWQALRELIDTGLDEAELAAIRRTIMNIGGIEALHLLRTRRVGGRALVDVHIIVDGHVSVSEGHQIGETVRATLIDQIEPVMDVMVHIDVEEDTTDATYEGLPLRNEISERLNRYFTDIEEARLIERTTLHYLAGRIDVELLLPLKLAPDAAAAQHLRHRFASAAAKDENIRSIDLYFR